MDRDSIRDLLDRTMRGLVLLIALSGLLPATSWAEPLRIWVMHNEPSEEYTDVTPALIRDALERWRTEHYVIGSNQFLEELAAFQSQHREDGEIALEFIRWDDAYNRISGALAAADQKTSPDVIQIGSTWVASFADTGVLTDISGYFDEDDFFPPTVESARPYGTDGLFAVPWFVDTRVLFYNKDLVGSPKALSTWDGFRDACKSFGQRGGINFFGIPVGLWRGHHKARQLRGHKCASRGI
jgi:ABC-type glycerol-3-phosphate transport system substrate-binding protein